MLFIGDIHGNTKVIIETIKKYSYTGSIIQVGDFGIGFPDMNDRLDELCKTLQYYNCKLYIMRGNHDNPNWFNGKVVNFPNIRFVQDYEFINIDDKNIFFVGGGVSVDRINREIGLDYWINEPIQNKLDLILDIPY